MKKLGIDAFRHLARDGGKPQAMVLQTETKFASEPVTDRTRRFTFSDGSVDRAKDVIDPNGWDLQDFVRNPVALFSHDATRVVGRAKNVGVVGGRLMGDIEFAPPEVSQDADAIFKLVAGGFLKAVSVGFLPEKWSFSSDPKRPQGIDFKRQILLEVSLCAVPCNAESLAQARSMGIDVSPVLRDFDAEAARQARIVEARKIAARLMIDAL